MEVVEFLVSGESYALECKYTVEVIPPRTVTPIPGTPMWKEALASSRYDLEADPVLTNNAIFPCQKEPFSWDRISRLKHLSTV